MSRITAFLLCSTLLSSAALAETPGIEKDQLTLGFIKLTDMGSVAQIPWGIHLVNPV